jgi:putative Ca2+/H+ antiporter (TMEM165/GDT1 family)
MLEPMDFAISLATFAVIFPAELPDKSTIAALVLGIKYKPQHVFAGVAAAFAVQVVIAVSAGQVLGMLPHRILDIVVGLFFFGGAYLIARQQGGEAIVESEIKDIPDTPSFWRVSATAFSVVFLAEFGDLTQIATANLAAKFHNPLSVGVGSVLALWSVGAIGIWGGKNLLRVIPMKLFTRFAAIILAVFGVVSFVSAIRG